MHYIHLYAHTFSSETALSLYIISISLHLSADCTVEEGWSHFGQSCYLFVEREIDQPNAAFDCEQMGAHLVSVDSAQVNAHLLKIM